MRTISPASSLIKREKKLEKLSNWLILSKNPIVKFYRLFWNSEIGMLIPAEEI